MSLLTEFHLRTITMTGGLVAAGAAVIAEAVTTDPTVGTGSFLLGGAGLIAAVSAFTKDYWTDRQKQREHEVALLRIKTRNHQTHDGLREMYNWAKAAKLAVSSLPPVPELSLDDDLEQEPEKQNA